ncbi:MAG: Uma2 family endonuclease [Niabella sp.]|nr:Uma2 family endonuclease [Niabella sp.]
MIPDLYIPTYTVRDWELWEGYWELIKGVPVAMSPSPLNKHQFMGSDLHAYFHTALQANRSLCNCRVLYEQDWIIDETNVVRPDILIACGNLDPEGHITKAPVLIVEIFSKATRLKDRNTKYALYEFCGVKYYLMADPDDRSLQVFELMDNKYKELFPPFHFKLTEDCQIAFDVSVAIPRQ